MMLIQPPKLRLQDLVEKTGFTDRQIRFYIARGLVPGAERKGPEATYTQATLDRLLLIKHLKGIRLHPTGRHLTLEEMRHTIDALGEEGAWRVRSGSSRLQILDTDALLPPRNEIRARRLDDGQDEGDGRDTSGRRERRSAQRDDAPLESLMCASPISHIWEDHISFQSDAPARQTLEALGELGGLLGRLLTTLEGMAATVAVREGSEAPAWRRLGADDLEIQVREPANVEESGRLGRHAAALRTLLSPYLEIL